jgi:hypothetical protein
MRIDDAEHTDDSEVLDGRVCDLVAETVGTGDSTRGDEFLAQNNDTFRTTRSFVLDLLELDACVASKRDNRVGLGRPVLGTSSKEDIRSTLDNNPVGTPLIVRLEDCQHPFVLGIERHFEDARHGLSEVIARRTRCSEAEDGAVCGVTHNGALLEGKMDGCGVEGSIVTEKGSMLQSN